MFMNMTDVDPLATMMIRGHTHLNFNLRYSHPRLPSPSPCLSSPCFSPDSQISRVQVG